MDAKLVFTTGLGLEMQPGKITLSAGETPMDPILGFSRRTIGPDTVLDDHLAALVWAKRGVDAASVIGNIAVDNGPVGLSDFTVFPDTPQLAGGLVSLGKKHDAAGFPIEAIDKVDRAIAEVQAYTTCETGARIGLGGVTYETGRFVDSQQRVIFMQYFKQVAHALRRRGFGLSSGAGMKKDEPQMRQATNTDCMAVCELVFGVLREYGLTPDPEGTDADLMDLEEFYRNGWFAVMEMDGLVVGSVGLLPAGDGVMELRKMYLQREWRGRGWGKLLIENALSEARSRDARKVVLETAGVLVEAARLYRQFGFKLLDQCAPTERCDEVWELDLKK